jgi:hypothetical protein
MQNSSESPDLVWRGYGCLEQMQNSNESPGKSPLLIILFSVGSVELI